MKALIIGGGGFVGPYLVNHLHDDLGYEVAVTKTAKEQLALSNAVVYDCDILNKSEITDVLETVRPDYIFHLAAQSSVSVSWKNPALTIDVNIKGAVNMLDAVRELDYKPRVLLIGSGEEYGHIRQEECPIIEASSGKYLCGNKVLPEYAWQHLCGGIPYGCHDGPCI